MWLQNKLYKLKLGVSISACKCLIYPLLIAKMSERTFQLNVVLDSFRKARLEDGSLVIDEYVRGYDELCIFFDMLGTVFGFITSDVRDKIGILQHHRNADNGDKYKTVQSMFEFEIAYDLTAANTRPLSGSRTLLRLHRALAFTALFMRKLSESTDSDSSGSLASEAYSCTLANFHPWLIRKAALLAMYTLPSVGDLIKKVAPETSNRDTATKLLVEVVEAIDVVYNETEELYTKNNLHGLP